MASATRAAGAVLRQLVQARPPAGADAPDAALPALPTDAHGLQALAEQAGAHGVDGHLLHAVSGPHRSEAAAALRLVLQPVVEARAAHRLRLLAGLRAAVDVLTAAGVPAVLLKGALAAGLHPQPALRFFHDVDLLVSPGRFGEAVSALQDAGMPVVDRNWTRIRQLTAGELHLALPYGGTLDLHWALTFHADGDTAARGRLTDGLLARATPRVVDGVSVLAPDPPDVLLQLARHAATSGADRLLWLVDVAGACREVDATGGWPDVVRRAAGWPGRPGLALVLQRAVRSAGAQVPDGVLPALAGGAPATATAWLALVDGVERWRPVGDGSGRGTPARVLAHCARRSPGASLAAAAARPLRVEPSQWRARGQAQAAGLDLQDDAGGTGQRSAYFAEVAAAGRTGRA